MIRFGCDCGKVLQAREEMAGKSVLCPACGQSLTVPEGAPPPSAVQSEEPPARPARQQSAQKRRPVLRDEGGWDEEESALEDRPPRRAGKNSGKAVASLVLGILSLFCNFVAGVPALILGLLALREIGQSKGRISGQGLAIGGIVTACVCTLLNCGIAIPIGLLLPAVQKVRDAAERMESQNNLKQMALESMQLQNNLKQMALAMQNYNALYGVMPPAAFGDPNKPPQQQRALLSWRVALLPYLERQDLYQRFKLDEPWDSPNNIKLLPEMPAVYKLPSDATTPPDHTHYQVFVGNGAAFEKTHGMCIPHEFLDGLANTILIVEAERAVPWTKPEDISFDPNKPIWPLLSTYSRMGCNVALADGSVRVLYRSVSESTLKAAITRKSGDVLGPDW